MMLLWLPFCAALLTGCETVQRLGLTEIRIERPKVDPTLLTCPEEPAPPAAGTQRDAAAFIVDLREAGATCRGNLAAVRQVLAPPDPGPPVSAGRP
jgi:hypothetical protein